MARRAALLLVLLFVGAAGCRGDAKEGTAPEAAPGGPLPPSLEPIVIPNPGRRAAEAERDRRPVEPVEEGWEDKWETASRYAASGFDAQALALLDAALADRPPAPWGDRMRGLRQSLRLRRAEERLLRVDARPTRDYVRFRTDVDVWIRIRNVSREDIVLAAPASSVSPGRPEVSPTALVLEIVRRDRDVLATELRRTWTQTVYLQAPGGREIRIPPGGAHETKVRIPAADVGEPLSGLRILEIEGTLRPTGLRIEGEEEAVHVPIRRGRVVVLPDGFEPLARDPIGSLETAVGAVAPAHLLIATEFVPRDEGPRAMRALARALSEGDPALRTAALGAIGHLRERLTGEPRAPLAEPLVLALEARPGRAADVIEGLEALTSQGLPPDARLWLDWWRKEKDARTPVAPAGGRGRAEPR
jgi:hypothetical protein